MYYAQIVKRLLGIAVMIFFSLFLSFSVTAGAPITKVKESSIQPTSTEYSTSQPTIKKEPTIPKTKIIQKSKKQKNKKIVKKQKRKSKKKNIKWTGQILTKRLGTVVGPSGKETYYNLPMQGVIKIMKELGYRKDYWVRDDGVKMYGKYIMCAANLDLRPKGTIVETSLGTAMVCDTGSFAESNPRQIDIAVDW